MERNDLPIGFSFTLAQNPDAMMNFSRLSDPQRAEILERARAASSREEMRSLVHRLSVLG